MTRVTPQRRYAKAYVGMLTDPDFLLLEADERQLYNALWIRADTNNCGVGPWQPDQMAHLIGASATPDDVRRVAATLQIRKYVFVDETTGEILVRSYIRHDGVVAQPNMVKPMVTAFNSTRSPMLRQMIANELHRLRAEFRPRPNKAHGFQDRGLLELLRKNPASVSPERLEAWAAHNPYRPVITTPADDFVPPAPSGPVWTPANDFAPSDLGEPLGGTLPPTLGGNPSPNPWGEGLGETHAERDGVTTTRDIQKIKDLAHPPGAQYGSTSTEDPGEPQDGTTVGIEDDLPGASVRFLTGLPLDITPVPTGRVRHPDPDGPYTAEFERFWAAWNRHGDKRPAFKAWCRALRLGVPNDFLISRAAPTFNARHADRYVKQAHTWLKNRGWENDPGKAVRDRAADVAAGAEPDPDDSEIQARKNRKAHAPRFTTPADASVYDAEFGAGRRTTVTDASVYDAEFGAGRRRNSTQALA